jgi:mycobactin salicyl-AMP ligase
MPEPFMTALARVLPVEDAPEADPFGWGAVRLSNLLAATADRRPHRLAFHDQPNREVWSGRPRIAWSYANAQHVVDRLATFLAGLELPAGAPVAISLPNGSEACVALLAVERAGYVPCLLPSAWPEEMLGWAIEAAHVVAVICQGRIADERPAEAFCRLAARYYGLRFICAFGPQAPDGVVDLDRAIIDTKAGSFSNEAGGHAGVVTFEKRDGVPRPVFRPFSSLVAAAAHFLVTEKVGPNERILSLIAPDDHRGLVTGLAASLVAGASLECQGLFESAALDAALASDVPTHLVAPAFMEPALDEADLPDSVVSVVLVHEAPLRFKSRGELKRSVTDVLAFGELACLARTRGAVGHLTFSLDGEGGLSEASEDLLRVRRDEDGTIHFAGAAAEIYDLARGAPVIPAQDSLWRSSGFKADLFAGIVIGVR